MKAMLAMATGMLAFAAPSAVAQTAFPKIDIGKIEGAEILQPDQIDPRDLVEVEGGVFRPKPNARFSRRRRTCALNAIDARTVAEALSRGRVSPVQWKGLGADMAIRFEGAEGPDGKLVAVLEGIPKDKRDGERRIFFAGVAAYLSKEDQAIVGRIGLAAGCPFTVDEVR